MAQERKGMWLSDLSIKQPVFITMIMAALAVTGYVSYRKLGVELTPDISFPVVLITTAYPGASSQEVERTITEPIEEAVSTISGVENVRSTSSDGLSSVVVEFKMGTNVDIAAMDVRERVAIAKRKLPKDVQDPTILKFEMGMLPVVTANVSADRPLDEIKAVAEDLVKPNLLSVKGVASVDIYGGLEREIKVELDRERMAAYNISASMVKNILSSESVTIPAGKVEEGGKELFIKTSGELRDLDEIREIPITTVGGNLIRLGDIAKISDSFKEPTTIARLNGKPSVILRVQKQSGTNTVIVCDRIRKRLSEIGKMLPKGYEVHVLVDESKFIRRSKDDVIENIILGGILASLIVFAFFRDFRNTIITVAGLPIVVIGTFLVLYALGYTINMLTLMALALSIGFLIDDAIVVRENIFRHMEKKGEDAVTAASVGTWEVGLAVISTTLTIVAVFMPIAFTGGIAGLFFRQFGITASAAVLLSLFEAFTFAPMLSSRFFTVVERGRKGFWGELAERWGRIYDRIDEGYRSLLAWSLKHRGTVIAIGVASFIPALILLPFLGINFIRGGAVTDRIGISVDAPPGSSLRTTDRIISRMEKLIAPYPEVDYILSLVGSLEGKADSGSIYVGLKEKVNGKKVSVSEFRNKIRPLLEGIPGAKISLQSMSSISLYGSSIQSRPIAINIKGGDLKGLNSYASTAYEAIKGIKGIVDPDCSVKAGKPEIQITLDRKKISDLSLSTAQIAAALRSLVAGDMAAKFRERGKEYEITVSIREGQRKTISDIADLPVFTKTGPIPLREIAKIEEVPGPAQINRMNRQRIATITADLEGRSTSEAMADIRKALDSIPKPPGVSYEFTGISQYMIESFQELGKALALAVIFIYMVLASLFASFVQPFIIMLSLPLSIIGAVLALFITGNSFDIMGMIGIIMLMGLVAKNAILLIDYTNRLRRTGYERDDAILEAGPTRLRPILMTTLAIIFGMIPVALGLGAASEMRAPMAITVIGGVTTSLLLTLIVVPVAYTLVDDLSARIYRRKEMAITQQFRR
jgi:HAE1 family hydrophobic/amphiphilic exporter-1